VSGRTRDSSSRTMILTSPARWFPRSPITTEPKRTTRRNAPDARPLSQVKDELMQCHFRAVWLAVYLRYSGVGGVQNTIDMLLVIDALPGGGFGLYQPSAVGILVRNSEVTRVHVGTIGISEAKTAKVLGSLTRHWVEIGIGLSSLVALVHMVRRGS
jgi:hypothetical protein